jgi:hypothetical protein
VRSVSRAARAAALIADVTSGDSSGVLLDFGDDDDDNDGNGDFDAAVFAAFAAFFVIGVVGEDDAFLRAAAQERQNQSPVGLARRRGRRHVVW